MNWKGMMLMLQKIERQARQVMEELLSQAKLKPGQIIVVGCSTSEIMGESIGKASSMEAAQAVYQGLMPVLQSAGVRLAAQCCEHLNRALIVEKETAVALQLDVVNVVPKPEAGGSFPTRVYQHMRNPVAVERIVADAGLDIGGTLIGMHLRAVAVPVRLSLNLIGEARILCARTRPKYIGGPRAAYLEL